MVDAAALLGRLHLSGHDVGDRWRELAGAWDLHADGGSYPFNDWHAVMAWLGAGRDSDVERIAAACRNGGNEGTGAARPARRTGQPLVGRVAGTAASSGWPEGLRTCKPRAPAQHSQKNNHNTLTINHTHPTK